MNILTAYYYASYSYLKDYIEELPELKLTNAKTYYGRIYKKSGEITAIALSKHNLEVSPALIEQDDIELIVETICHEFAHISHWEHSEEHEELTQAYKNLVLLNIRLDSLEDAV